jgi:hypothetical protein
VLDGEEEKKKIKNTKKTAWRGDFLRKKRAREGMLCIYN